MCVRACMRACVSACVRECVRACARARARVYVGIQNQCVIWRVYARSCAQVSAFPERNNAAYRTEHDSRRFAHTKLECTFATTPERAVTRICHPKQNPLTRNRPGNKKRHRGQKKH